MKAHHCHHFYVTSLPGNIMKNSVESKSAEIKILFMVRTLKCCFDTSSPNEGRKGKLGSQMADRKTRMSHRQKLANCLANAAKLWLNGFVVLQ